MIKNLPHLTSGSPVIPCGQEHNALPSKTSQTASTPHGFGSQGSSFKYTDSKIIFGIVLTIDIINHAQ